MAVAKKAPAKKKAAAKKAPAKKQAAKKSEPAPETRDERDDLVEREDADGAEGAEEQEAVAGGDPDSPIQLGTCHYGGLSEAATHMAVRTDGSPGAGCGTASLMGRPAAARHAATRSPNSAQT